MRLVETLLVRDEEPELVRAHVGFQRAAGVDEILAAGAAGETRAALEAEHGVRLLDGLGGAEADVRTALARAAVDEHGADWVVASDANEFWWPRAESLADVLAPIPPRYTEVQGLVRELVAPAGASALEERLTLRRPVADGVGEPPREAALLPLHRARPGLALDASRRSLLPGRVPLRAWYPVEVLRVPPAGAGGGEDGPLVEDTRLRDALARLPGPIRFRVPDVVDDAAYAVECAAVGEVDLPRLEAYVAELERRVAVLEQRLWPRVQRRLARLARRS